MQRTVPFFYQIITPLLIVYTTLIPNAHAEEPLDLHHAVILGRSGKLPNAEQSAKTVLIEEIAKRTGIKLETATKWTSHTPIIALASMGKNKLHGKPIPLRKGENLPEFRKDGFRLYVDKQDPGTPIIWILGADPRGTLFGVGALLRKLECSEGQLTLSASLDWATAPVSPIRGHQLGYRATANSWDAWTVEQFDQYIRELTFFGANSIEGIPFHDERPLAYQKMDRREMNKAISRICEKYGLDYWVWTPADFDLKDTKLRDEMIQKHEAFYRDCPTLSGVFYPGGDPGDNPPEQVLPFMAELAKRLIPIHPNAKIWLSLQGFSKEQTQYVLDYLKQNDLKWLGGLCEGPGSPSIALLRGQLPKQYGLRMYPDITHNKLCQYPVLWWDQAYALTLGREAINPRPAQYASIHNWLSPYCDGFISYSDGVHDDVNKTIWSALSWDPTQSVREVMVEYARVFFNSKMDEEGANGILALENNWRGPLLNNGAVEGTLLEWERMARNAPELATNWRWQMCQVRACYDAYDRRRLINETRLEQEANAALLEAPKQGSESAMNRALAILNQSVEQPVSPELRQQIVALYDALFKSICLQSSVEKYHASGGERGASLDYLDVPLNNRWWLEDEFTNVRKLPSEEAKCARLKEIATWDNPGPGSFYDDIGNTANSPHVIRAEAPVSNPEENGRIEPTFWWLDDGKSRLRHSWQVTMDFPESMIYEGIDPEGTYVVRTSGYGQCLLKINGTRVAPTVKGTQMGEINEFPVTPEQVKDRKLVLTFDKPTDEENLGWRQRSRLAEVWLLKK